jgi:hypothetical protein
VPTELALRGQLPLPRISRRRVVVDPSMAKFELENLDRSITGISESVMRRGIAPPQEARFGEDLGRSAVLFDSTSRQRDDAVAGDVTVVRGFLAFAEVDANHANSRILEKNFPNLRGAPGAGVRVLGRSRPKQLEDEVVDGLRSQIRNAMSRRFRKRLEPDLSFEIGRVERRLLSQDFVLRRSRGDRETDKIVPVRVKKCGGVRRNNDVQNLHFTVAEDRPVKRFFLNGNNSRLR